jgi:hypothetical protein
MIKIRRIKRDNKEASGDLYMERRRACRIGSHTRGTLKSFSNPNLTSIENSKSCCAPSCGHRDQLPLHANGGSCPMHPAHQQRAQAPWCAALASFMVCLKLMSDENAS